MLDPNLDWYCQLFIDSSLNQEDLISLLEKITGGTKKISYINTDILDIHVKKNHDWNEEKKDDAYQGFLFYRFFLDIAPQNENIQFESYVGEIRHLVKRLNKHGFRTAAAFDYEELLQG